MLDTCRQMNATIYNAVFFTFTSDVKKKSLLKTWYKNCKQLASMLPGIKGCNHQKLVCSPPPTPCEGTSTTKSTAAE